MLFTFKQQINVIINSELFVIFYNMTSNSELNKEVVYLFIIVTSAIHTYHPFPLHFSIWFWTHTKKKIIGMY